MEENKKQMNPILSAFLMAVAFAGGYALLTFLLHNNDYYIGVIVGVIIFIARVVRLKMASK